MTTGNACMTCVHYRVEESKRIHVPVCDAFPGEPGIPDPILLAEHAHRDPYPGDHGIQWEVRPEYAWMFERTAK